MVIGGQAVLVYGEPRLTKDVDITLGATLERLDEVVGAVRTLGLEILVDPDEFTPRTMVVPCRDPTTGTRIDLVLSDSAYEREALRRVRTIDLAGARVRFVSPEDLIVHKVIAGRPRDLEDVRSILVKNPALDLAWVRRWLDEFTAALAEPFRERFDELARSAERRSE